MKHYELTYIVPVKFAGDEFEKIQKKVKEFITKEGGEINYEEDIGKKKLAYPIQHNSQAFYVVNEFDLDGSKLSTIENKIVLTTEIIRHLIISKDKMSNEERKIQKIKTQGKDSVEKKPAMSDQFNIENQLSSQDKKEEKKEDVVLEKKVVSEKKDEAKKEEVEEKKKEEKKEETKKVEKKEKEDDKAKMEDLDKKLDEIIDSNLF